MKFELKDFVSKLVELMKEYQLLHEANILYDNTTYLYQSGELHNICYDTKVTDYICDKDIEGLVFAYVPGLYATYDYEVDFEDSLMDLIDEYNLSYSLLDASTICIFED